MDLKHLQAVRENLKIRAALFRAIREYFDLAGFMEVETDIRIPAPAPEEYIESIAAEGSFLRTSPEIAMKIMVAAGYERIYQIGRCFRADEFGSKHRTEFTMLEFYAAGMDYRTLAEFTFGFIRHSAEKLFGRPELDFKGEKIDLTRGIEWITVREAFDRWCGISMEEAARLDSFDELMVTQIEPNLGRDRVTVLTDYPADRASLARLKPEDRSCAERWEMYIGGLELANSFGELIDPEEQRCRFEAARKFRSEHHMHDYPMPEDFFSALKSGMPETSGGAMGLDRLAMVFCNTSDIADVRAE